MDEGKMRKQLPLLAILGITGCTALHTERDINKLTPKQTKELAFYTGVQSYMQRDTNASLTPLTQQTRTQLGNYIEFPKTTFQAYFIPEGTNTTQLYWEGKIDTTAPFINQSIPHIEYLATLLPAQGEIYQLTFPDQKGIISAQSGLRCLHWIPAGTNEGVHLKITRTEGITQERDSTAYTLQVTTGLPTTTIKAQDKNYRGFLNTLEAVGMGMAVVPFQGGIFGMPQALQEATLYWNTRHPTIQQTRIQLHTDLPEKNARAYILAETAQRYGANQVYCMKTTNGTVILYGANTKQPLAGPHAESNLPAHTIKVTKEERARHHGIGLLLRAAQAGGGAGLTYAFPSEKVQREQGVTGSATGGSGGR
jgi:hypothetical protein